MIGRLRGALVAQDEDRILVECGGVGYEVHVSVHTLLSLPATGEEVTLLVFTHMLESRITLYGFGSGFERDLFDLLITVKGVGPASAVGILSGSAAPADIARLIAEEKVSHLTKLRGVGKKTAEMLVVELREKCEALLARAGAIAGGARVTPAARPAPSSPSRLPILDDVAAALVQLGWRPAEADRVVAELEIGESTTLESLLRQALRSMPR